jgi:hypothetical protein
MSVTMPRLFVMGLIGFLAAAHAPEAHAAGQEEGTIFKPGFRYTAYQGEWSPGQSLSEFKRADSRRLQLGEKTDQVPGDDHFVVISGYLRMRTPGTYRFGPGYKAGRYNVMKINDQLVHRKQPGDRESEFRKISLSAGFHPFKIIYLKKNPNRLLLWRDGQRVNQNHIWSKVPFEQRMQNELVGAFNSLKAHITGQGSLSDKQIEAHLKTIKDQREIFGYNKTIIRAALGLVRTFEREKGPLWVEHKAFNTRGGEPTGLNWAIFQTMQSIMDWVYTDKNIERYSDLLAGFKFESSKNFPGAVEPPQDPSKRHTVKINGSFPKGMRQDSMGNGGNARKPTGAYLAPGSIATVTVPRSLADQGYMVRVGAHSWDMSNKPWVPRLYRVSRAYPIDDTTVQVANPLGGGIYIEVPYGADAGVVDVTVQNAVRSPYFSAKSFDKTSLSQWREVERHRDAPWADFQSEKFMMQVPTSWIDDMENPAKVVKSWDKAVDAMNFMLGLPKDRGRETLYLQVDLQNRAGVLAPGYPTVNSRYNPDKAYDGPVKHHLVQGARHAPSYVFHEKGHGYFFQKFSGEMESMVNLLHVAVMNRAFGMDLDKALRESRRSGNKYRTLDTTAITWMTSFNFVEDQPMHPGEKAYQIKGHAKFVDMAKLFGWDSLRAYFVDMNRQNQQAKRAGEKPPWGKNNNHRQYALQMCKSTGIDLRPLLHFWGIHPKDGGIYEGEAFEQLRKSRKIYDRLVHYRSLVPEDNEAFREHARQWWGKKPSIKKNWTQREHARQWSDKKLREDRDARPGGEEYDVEAARNVEAQVEKIINTYFPNGRPSR